MPSYRIAAAQTPELLGEPLAAISYMADVSKEAASKGVSLLCFPEAFLQGYFTEEKDARHWSINLETNYFTRLLSRLPDSNPMLVFGMIEADGNSIYNSAVVVHRRRLVGRYRKSNLLKREACFTAGHEPQVFEQEGLHFGINICSDTSSPAGAEAAAKLGASLLVCPANNMLPQETAVKLKDEHHAVRAARCRENKLWLISADVTGERDGQIAMGPTAVISPAGKVVAQLPLGNSGLLVFDLPVSTQLTMPF